MLKKCTDSCSPCIVLLLAIATSSAAMTLHSSDEWGVTQVDVRKLTYAWTITNFSFCDQETGEMIESPVFSTGDDDEHKWQLHLYPKGFNRNYTDYLTLFLKHVFGNKVKVTFNLALLNGYNKIVNVKSLPYTFGPSSAIRNGYYRFIENSSVYNKAYDLLPDDRLTIIVEIYMNVRLVNISGHCTAKSSKIPEETHFDNFAKLLDDKLFSDVLLLVGDEVFEAHKAILASVSPVLREELQKNVNNDTKSILHIPYTNADTFKEVLRFIYSGKVENIKNVAKELFIAADRFEIHQLKSLCEEVLCQNLNTENAVDTLYIAENYKAENLREQASNFIVAHASEVTNSIGFKTMELVHPHPILRIFRSLTNTTQT